MAIANKNQIALSPVTAEDNRQQFLLPLSIVGDGSPCMKFALIYISLKMFNRYIFIIDSYAIIM